MTDAISVDELSLPLPASEHVEESKAVADPAATTESKEPIFTTGAEEPRAPMTFQEDACAQPASVPGDCTPSHPEDKVDVTNVEAAQTAEDRQTGGSSFTR